MAAAKTERLMNLLIMLLVQRHYVPKEKIREILYPESSDEAFEKMFERDKDELRSLGVPIEVGSTDPLFDDEPGYRIRPSALQLPDISLTADEASVVALATRVWDHAALASATTNAVRKLTAAEDVDTTALQLVQPLLSADEPSFDGFLEAVQSRTAVEFEYTRARGSASTRHLQPWGVARSLGRWYVVGFDTDRGAERVFRLSRVVGTPRLVGRPHAFEVPVGTSVRDIAARLAPDTTPQCAVLLVRPGTGHALRRGVHTFLAGVEGPDGTEWDRLVIERTNGDLASEVLAHGPDVYVVEPAELRAAVIDRLDKVLA